MDWYRSYTATTSASDTWVYYTNPQSINIGYTDKDYEHPKGDFYQDIKLEIENWLKGVLD